MSTVGEARNAQKELAKQVSLEDRLSSCISLIGGVDVRACLQINVSP